jgi:hypothetical protein
MDPGRAFEQSEPWKIDSTQNDNLSKLKKKKNAPRPSSHVNRNKARRRGGQRAPKI